MTTTNTTDFTDAEGEFTLGSFVVAVDLGQSRDYSAVAVVERVEHFAGWHDKDRGIPRLVDHWEVRHLERAALHTPYPAIVSQVGRLLEAPELRDAALVLDATGVGRAVCDLFTDAYRNGACGNWFPRRLTITAGREEGRGPGGLSVPKRQLVSTLVAAVQSGRLTIAAGIPLADTLRKELVAFSVKLTAKGNDTYEAARESDHDDLVLAVSMGVYYRHGAVGARVVRQAA